MSSDSDPYFVGQDFLQRERPYPHACHHCKMDPIALHIARYDSSGQTMRTFVRVLKAVFHHVLEEFVQSASAIVLGGWTIGEVSASIAPIPRIDHAETRFLSP